MRRQHGKILFLSLAVIFLGPAVHRFCTIRQTVQQTLADERARLIDRHNIPFEVKVLTPYTGGGDVKIIQNATPVTAVVEWGDAFFAATGGGLVKYARDGRIVKHFTVLDGLPESELTGIAAFQERLFIGTRSNGLVEFDGNEFRKYILRDRDLHSINLLSTDDGALLIGTSNGGLIRFDGERLSELTSDSGRINAATAVFRHGSSVITGTFADGLYVKTGSNWSQITTAHGLPSNRITGFAEWRGSRYAATDLGLALIGEDHAQQVTVLPTLSGLAIFDDRMFLTNAHGDVFRFERSPNRLMEGDGAGNSLLTIFDDALWPWYPQNCRAVVDKVRIGRGTARRQLYLLNGIRYNRQSLGWNFPQRHRCGHPGWTSGSNH